MIDRKNHIPDLSFRELVPDETPWNCLDEHGPNAEDGDPELVIVLAGTDKWGRRTLYCAGCAEDLVSHPELHEGSVLVPTNLLDEEELAEIFGPDWRDGNADWEPGDLRDDCRTDCLLRNPDAAIVAVYVNRHRGHLGTVCTDLTCYREIQGHPNDYAMYGTHTLPEWLLAELFPAEH
jgi:hypothetical protein